MIATLLACMNEGDEVIVFEPFYENYWPDSQLSGARIRYVSLQPPDWSFDAAELRAAFSGRTRALIVNTPNNPSGRVFTRSELELIGSLCQEFDALFITDEIYEHITFDGAKHIPPITLPGLREHCVVVNSLSKTFSVTGWRVGWVIAPPDLTASIRKVHDFLTVGAATPLQQAGVTALAIGDGYYTELAKRYQQKRDLLMEILTGAGFRPVLPRGAYYIMCDASALGFKDDVALALFLVSQLGVAAVPGSSFFSRNGSGDQLIRFCFAKKEETLSAAAERLARLPQLV
jgi:aminotransferase